MNILLIQPPTNILKNEFVTIVPPLGLLYLAAVLEKEGHQVAVLDSILEGFHNVKREGEGYRVGCNLDEVERRIKESQPDIVGITCPFSIMDEEVHKIAMCVKNYSDEIVVILGGAHPSSCPQECLSDKNIDFVVLGEGEQTLVKLVDALQSNREQVNEVDGIAFRNNGDFHTTPRREFLPDLDCLPFPARHLLPMEDYFKIAKAHSSVKRKRFTSVITSRGCPYRCVFCSIHSVWGYQWRPRSPQNVLDEIEHLVKNYGIEEIHFEDDNLCLDKERMGVICDGIRKRKLNITWMTPNGVGIQTLDHELLAKMKASGCYQLNLAIESGSKQVLKEIIHKPVRLDKVKNIVNLVKNSGIWAHGFFVIGFPGETKEDIKMTIDFAKNLKLDSVSFFIATPYPGSELLEIATKRGYIGHVNYKDLRVSKASITTPEFTAQEIEECRKSAYRKVMLSRIKREFFHLSILKRLRSLDDVRFLMRKLGRFIKVLK